jgi:SAM-dependent methyltransferase
MVPADIDLVHIDCEVCLCSEWEPVIRLNGYSVGRCVRCGFVYVNPQPRRRRNQDAGWYDDEGDPYVVSLFPVLKRVYSRGLAEIERHMSGRGRLLDVGCGFGYFLKVAAERGWEPAGVDVSARAVNHARGILGLDHVERTELGDASFSPGSFDAVTLWNSLEHVPNPREVLTQSFRLLKSKGVLLVRVPNVRPRDILLRWMRVWNAAYKPPEHLYLCGTTPPDHLFGFGPATLAQLMRNVGFRRVIVCPSALRTDNRGGRAIELTSRLLFGVSARRINLAPTILGIGVK